VRSIKVPDAAVRCNLASDPDPVSFQPTLTCTSTRGHAIHAAGHGIPVTGRARIDVVTLNPERDEVIAPAATDQIEIQRSAA